MAEIFGRVANITDVESKLPSGKKDATLWETEEQALRFIIEDGKLNLCLRLLVEFKSRQIEARRSGRGPMVSLPFSLAALSILLIPIFFVIAG
jgi:hypothetical protein